MSSETARETRESTPLPVGAEDVRQLERTWAQPRGFIGWFTPVNHRVIGKRFIVTAFVFLILGGIEALVMRLQLARAENTLVDPDLYAQLFTMHGTTMMFFFAVPIMEGFAIYFTPLMIGTRDMAFPRMNAFGYYVYLIAGIVLYASFLIGLAPDAGWFNYVPLAAREFSPSNRIDIWATMITFIEISALVAAVEMIVTIFKQRAPGMTLGRMPIFVWAMLVMSFMIVFAMPAVMVASIMLALDRNAGMHFFNAAQGGDPLLWQHLFWFFGHPEVYIIFVPALGFVSAIVTASARRRLVGYTAVAIALVAIGIVSFGLWVHHMFTVGLPQLGASFFTAASMMIAIPSGVQIFCWIATMWGSRPVFRTSLLFVIGFVLIFVIGGITGIMVASVPFDQQVHDTYFVVAHFHYVLIGGAVFPLFGAFYHWFPKFTGRMLSERIGKWNFFTMFIGFNVAFFPMHQLGFEGMPRRVYTYLAEMGWERLNLLSTVGAFLFAAGAALFLINAIVSWRHGTRAGDDPWNADTLEWLTASPPAPYNFRAIPVVDGRYPLWDAPGGPAGIGVATGLRSDRREVLVTSTAHAEPRSVVVLPGPSAWPFALAIVTAAGFLGAVWNLIWVPIAFVFAFLVLAAWHWPRHEERTPPWKDEDRVARELERGRSA